VDTQKTVNNLINCLTDNEDLRQELWVHYLSGNPVDSFVSHLQKVSLSYSESTKLKESVWNLLQNPPSTTMTKVLGHFSDFERSILCLLVLGLSITEISAYKGISEVRIRQTVAAIRYNSTWETVYGVSSLQNTGN
jgi:hypothetical protein